MSTKFRLRSRVPISRWIPQEKLTYSASSTTTTINMQRSATKLIRCWTCIISAIQVRHLSNKTKRPQPYSTREINMYKSIWTITCSHRLINISQGVVLQIQKFFREIKSGEHLDSRKRRAKKKSSNNLKTSQAFFIKRVISTAFSTTVTTTLIDSLTSRMD